MEESTVLEGPSAGRKREDCETIPQSSVAATGQPTLEGFCYLAAHVTEDGRLNIADVVGITRMIFGA